MSGAIPEVQFTAPEFQPGSPLENTSGHVDLVWEPVSDNPTVSDLSYELVSASSDQFLDPVSRYSGSDIRSFVSGLEGRSYYFRVRAIDPEGHFGPWSDTLALEVNYVSEARVIRLMLMGAICLLATILIIVGGSLKERNTYQTQT